MHKHELIGLTLDRLLEHFKLSPESFEYLDSKRDPSISSFPSITWQPKIQLSGLTSTTVYDPNNDHAVMVMFNTLNNELSCSVFMKTPPSIRNSKPDSYVSSARWFERLRSNYKKFKKLRDLIIARDLRKENMTYLRKLSSVFPDTLDNHLFKD